MGRLFKYVNGCAAKLLPNCTPPLVIYFKMKYITTAPTKPPRVATKNNPAKNHRSILSSLSLDIRLSPIKINKERFLGRCDQNYLAAFPL